MKKVCSKTANWICVLMLIIPGSVLHAEDPTSTALVPPALHHALASSLSEATSIDTKTIPTPPTGSWGIVSEGDGGGGIFRDSDSEAEAWLGSDSVGVQGFGSVWGGYFKDSDNSGYAYVGNGDYGIAAWGNTMGGYFKDYDSPSYAYAGFGMYGIEAGGTSAGGYFLDYDGTGNAYVGYGNRGIEAGGTGMGGYFRDTDSTGYAYVGHGDRGIWGYGEFAGGYFEDTNGTGFAHVGKGDRGIWGYGEFAGGYFEDTNGTGYAHVGYGDRGIEAYGNETGGYFADTDGTSSAHVATASNGIWAFGELMGGRFEDSDGSGAAFVGYQDYGIQAYGIEMGGYFYDDNGTGIAYLAYDRPSGNDDRGGTSNDGEYGVYAAGSKAGGYFEHIGTGFNYAYLARSQFGIEAYGSYMGGEFVNTTNSGFSHVAWADIGIKGGGNLSGGLFQDVNSSGYAYVGYSTYKINGVGSVNFVQNHPYDASSVIVYAAPEGDEVATYTRGTARLVGGEATVLLGKTFKWVTNPDVGLTAYLIPVGGWCDLYVAEKGTSEVTVRSRDGSDCAFDFLVYGLRIGFEESSVVQEKEMEAYIPSMADHRQLYERRPDLRIFNSLERFKGMRHAIDPKAKLDLSRAEALRDAIIEFDPAVHELPMPPGHEERPPDDPASAEAQQGTVHRVRPARGGNDHEPATDHSDLGATAPVDVDGNIYAPSFRPPSREVAALVDVSEPVEPGDVLVIDSEMAGLMRRGFEGHDSGVVGVVLDSQSPAISDEVEAETALHAEVAMAGVVKCKVDASYGAIWPGNLLVTSPTSGHAMRTEAPLPGTIVGKALEPLEEGTGTIRVLVMLR